MNEGAKWAPVTGTTLSWGPVDSPAPTPFRVPRWVRKWDSEDRKADRILARQIARAEHHIRARPLLHNGKAWR